MENRIPIAMPIYNRPDLLKQVFEALSNCFGIQNFEIITSEEPDQPETSDMVLECLSSMDIPFSRNFNDERLGCNVNCRKALELAFELTDAPWAVCLEDDILLAKDALLWYMWAIEKYKDHEMVGCVGTYRSQREGFEIDMKDLRTCHMRGCVLPWGWAITKKRFEEFAPQYTADRERTLSGAWDDFVSQYMSENALYQVYPNVSRSQNIGEYGFKTQGQQTGYGSKKYWLDHQYAHSYIMDVWPEYPIVEYEEVPKNYFDAVKRTRARVDGETIKQTMDQLVPLR